jgi:hypothetical protein
MSKAWLSAHRLRYTFGQGGLPVAKRKTRFRKGDRVSVERNGRRVLGRVVQLRYACSPSKVCVKLDGDSKQYRVVAIRDVRRKRKAG